MWGKKQLAALIFSFVLYIIDLASDLYVAFQYRRNGDGLLFWLTAGIIIFSTFAVNIVATFQLKMNTAGRTCSCCFHLAMIFLFLHEIDRCRKEGAHVCSRGKHFSECDCEECNAILKESVEDSLGMSCIRSMETFCEAVPQCLLQVIVMIHRQSLPWYTIVSVVISFVSLVYSAYTLEKRFWIKEIVHSDPPINYIKPISYPTRSAVVFIIWQTLLLLGRLSAMALFNGFFYFIGLAFHWAVLLISTASHIIHKERESNPGAIRGIRAIIGSVLGCSFLLFIILSPFFFPLVFHVSYSSVVFLLSIVPPFESISERFTTVLLILVPMSFFIVNFGNILVVLFLVNYPADGPGIMPYYGIGSVYFLAFIFQAIYQSSYCHPQNVTIREWESRPGSAHVTHGTINIPTTP